MRLQKLSPSVATVKLLPVIGELMVTLVLGAPVASKWESYTTKNPPPFEGGLRRLWFG